MDINSIHCALSVEKWDPDQLETGLQSGSSSFALLLPLVLEFWCASFFPMNEFISLKISLLTKSTIRLKWIRQASVGIQPAARSSHMAKNNKSLLLITQSLTCCLLLFLLAPALFTADSFAPERVTDNTGRNIAENLAKHTVQ